LLDSVLLSLSSLSQPVPQTWPSSSLYSIFSFASLVADQIPFAGIFIFRLVVDTSLCSEEDQGHHCCQQDDFLLFCYFSDFPCSNILAESTVPSAKNSRWNLKGKKRPIPPRSIEGKEDRDNTTRDKNRPFSASPPASGGKKENLVEYYFDNS